MKIKDCLSLMVERDASDLFYRAGGPVRLRIDGKIFAASDAVLNVDDVRRALDELTSVPQRDAFRQHMDIDFGLWLEEFHQRFRVCIFMQRNTPSLVIRQVKQEIKSFEALNLPREVLEKLCREGRGLVLLTGSTGSGKSTAIASMIEYINNNFRKHILTVEEPIEFTFKDKQAIINQRELSRDVSSYEIALKAFTLQSPDVIYIGNIRDYETMSTALTAAETGSLVLSTLHTINAHQSIERMINLFPPHMHEHVAIQLSNLLKGVISLRLIPLKDKEGRIPAYESMVLTPTIARLVRERKLWEVPHYIEDGAIFGMQTFNQSLSGLVKNGIISVEDALEFSDSRDELLLALKGFRK